MSCRFVEPARAPGRAGSEVHRTEVAALHDVHVPFSTASASDVRRRRAAAVLLVGAALLQLLGQALLRLPGVGHGPGTGTWVLSHVVLVVAAIGLVAAMGCVALVVGPGPLTWLALALVVMGQGLTLAVLAVDLDVASASIDVIRALDTWDFMAVAGTVVMVLELRRRRGAAPGAELALLALAVPPLEGLVLLAAAAVVAGSAALAHSLAAGRGHEAPAWLAAVTVSAYVVAGAVSWQRAALAVVVLVWTVHHLRTSKQAAI